MGQSATKEGSFFDNLCGSDHEERVEEERDENTYFPTSYGLKTINEVNKEA